MQRPFQLCQQRNHFCSFYTCDSAARNDGDSKKKALPLFVRVNALLFPIQYWHASFPCVLQPETILVVIFLNISKIKIKSKKNSKIISKKLWFS
jgi:hypothetical protein